MTNNDYSIKKFTVKQLIIAIAATALCGLVMVWASVIKFFVIGEPVTTGVWLCILTLTISFGVFLGGILLFAIVSRTFIIAHPKYYIAFMTVVTISFLAHLYLSILSPLMIAPGLTAMIIVQISRQKQDALMLNLMESVMVMWVLLLESIMTDGEIFMVIGGNGVYLWLLAFITVINIGAGAAIPLVLKNKTRRINYIVLGCIIMLASEALYVLMSFIRQDGVDLFSYFWVVFVSGAIPLFAALVINPIMESAFNLVTDNRLAEWTDSRQPLLRRLATEAPGTYNHCLAVANFAEICATAIGEDPYLARAAAYYHDIGKLLNPSYFTENQSGYNPHDDILPEVSVEIIRKHSTDGYKLLKEHRLPEEIASVAIEHHGTSPIKVFYERAKGLTDGEVNIDDYRYHGRTPRSKISGIIMICDSSEAAIRAMDKPDGERVEKLLRAIIGERIAQGQFDECKLSMLDLEVIRKTIISAFGGVFHQRVKYPGGEK